MYTLCTPSLEATPAATCSSSEENATQRHPVFSTAFWNSAAHCGAGGGAADGSWSGAAPPSSSSGPGRLVWRAAGGRAESGAAGAEA
jgi:hypothetical protein